MYEHALLAGKFLPLHKGHEFLISEALRQSKRVTVFVVWSTDESISGAARAAAVSKTFPEVDVKLIANLGLDDADPESSDYWAVYTKDILGGVAPDVIFSSEEYGYTWAMALCGVYGRLVDHVCVDPKRTRIPVSATQIREHPHKYWQYINKYMRNEYLTRVLITGAESSGKTSLCQKLSEHYNTVYSPEYGRIYSEQVESRQAMTSIQERVIFAQILNEQPKLDAAADFEANKVVFYDTDLFVTSLWYLRWQKEKDSLYHAIQDEAYRRREIPNLILVMDPDTTFVQDGYREFEIQDERVKFTNDLRDCHNTELQICHTLTGDWKEREQTAIKLINKTMRGYS